MPNKNYHNINTIPSRRYSCQLMGIHDSAPEKQLTFDNHGYLLQERQKDDKFKKT
jgi:hypothetical protein